MARLAADGIRVLDYAHEGDWVSLRLPNGTNCETLEHMRKILGDESFVCVREGDLWVEARPC